MVNGLGMPSSGPCAGGRARDVGLEPAGAAAVDRLCDPGKRPVSTLDGGAQRGAGARACGQEADAQRGATREMVGLAGLEASLAATVPVAVERRAAAAGGAGAGAGRRPRHAADGRAIRRARPAHTVAEMQAMLLRPAAARGQDGVAGHARSGRSFLPGAARSVSGGGKWLWPILRRATWKAPRTSMWQQYVRAMRHRGVAAGGAEQAGAA